MTTPLDRLGRDGLLQRIAELEKERDEANRQLDAVFDRMGLHETGAPDTRGAAIIACWSSDVARIAALESGAEYRTMLENVTALQKRESAWVDETRALRRVLAGKLIARGFDQLTDMCEQLNVIVDLLIVRWRGDAKYGGAEAHADLPLGLGNPIEHETRVTARRDLEELQAFKKSLGNHTAWVRVIEEEWLELLTSESEERAEAEAIDVANVCLKMVEAIRIRRARENAK